MSTRGYPVTKPIRERRRAQAEARNAAWTELEPLRQLEMLDNRLGKGAGAKRQRGRILRALKGVHGS